MTATRYYDVRMAVDGTAFPRGAQGIPPNMHPAESERLCREALKQFPSDQAASFFLGISLYRQSRIGEAIDLFSRLIEADPRDERLARLDLYLSMSLRRAGDVGRALTHAGQAEQHASDPETICNLGLCLLDAGRLDEAEQRFKEVVLLSPDAPFGYYGLGCCLERLSNRKEARVQFRKAASLTPSHVPLLADIAESMAASEDGEMALQTAVRAHRANPSARTNRLLAAALSETGRARQALPHAKEAAAAEPESADAWALLGTVFQAVGNRDAGIDALKRSIELQPRQGSSWYALIESGLASTELAESMEAAKADGDWADSQLSLLDFALGRCYEKLGKYDLSYRAYEEANILARRLKFGDERFDPIAYSASLNQIVDSVRDWPKNALLAAGPPPTPIFVVGMIRSGTTLVQQILSSHPEIGAADEPPYWLDHWRETIDDSSKTLLPDELARVREGHRRILVEMAPGKRMVVDKMPENYSILGILAAAYPDAPFIHISRNPADTCLSIFATANRTRLPFMHDMSAIMTAYQEYEQQMERWRRLLPGRIHELRYEDLVSDQEAVTRRMLDWCGAEWNEATLHPERNDRQAATPSQLQVKEPVYNTAAGRAEHFREWLPAS
jgi:tetratricopeptide (TPR) repeat protein